jgi:tetratricopeptide (TPR) repeat protein
MTCESPKIVLVASDTDLQVGRSPKAKRPRWRSMSSNARPLAHMPYFEQLAELANDCAEWRSVSAALVVLRLFDSWMQEGAGVVSQEAPGLQAVRVQIASMDVRDSNRRLLARTVDSMVKAQDPRIVTVAPRLMAYGRELQEAAKWTLAADVYRTVLAYATPVEDSETVIAANMQLGRCMRVLAEWDESLSCFTAASQVATMTNDVMSILRARIQEAQIAIDRGNLPHAESLLDDTIVRAKESGLSEIRATAMHDRAHLASRRGRNEEALALQYEAFKGVRNRMARDRVLHDLGASFVQLGVYSAARDAFLVVAATAHEQYLRWTAVINLLDVAVHERRQPLFEQYRRDLENAALPPALAAYFYIYVAQGHRTFDQIPLATAAITRAIEIASSNRLGQAQFEAEEIYEGLKRDQARELREEIQIARTVTWSPEVRHIADALHELRTMAGVEA